MVDIVSERSHQLDPKTAFGKAIGVMEKLKKEKGIQFTGTPSDAGGSIQFTHVYSLLFKKININGLLTVTPEKFAIAVKDLPAVVEPFKGKLEAWVDELLADAVK